MSFDSHRAGGWNALYMTAVAEELDDAGDGIEVFSGRSEAQGIVRGRETRCCRLLAIACIAPPPQHFVLDPHGQRLSVSVE